MNYKTISGHYGTQYSLSHNNRVFIPKNVDPSRCTNNDFLVSAGQLVGSDFPYVSDMNRLWSSYRLVNQIYWDEYRIKSEELKKRLAEIREYQRRMSWLSHQVDENPVLLLLEILLLPLLIPIDIAADCYLSDQLEALDAHRFCLQFERETFLDQSKSLRDALHQKDRRQGTTLLQEMDTMVSIATELADFYSPAEVRFATIEEIYNKVFEPGFREFQTKQRKCRRYEGTYLEQIRQRQTNNTKSQSKNEKTRSQSEAIEIVFSIGDMDNTGYDKAPEDATKSEQLLKAFNRHLLSLPNVCVITTAELNTPGWQPPFRHGLILLNLTAHFDESTPGIHMTAIPYSRGCKRGPAVQPSLGRAFTGMGYPSTWREVTDENGTPLPKRDRNNNIIYDEDGSPRIRKEPEKQGIIDWIEEQKLWLEKEMDLRYGWRREYKGKHPRGNLSTPDYKVARAMERLTERENLFKQAVENYSKRILYLNQTLEQTVDEALERHPDFRIIVNYIQTCPESRFDQLFEEAMQNYTHLSENEYNKLNTSLSQLISAAEKKGNRGNHGDTTKEIETNR